MKYLGVDYGLKKIGLAISEGSFASPLGVLKVSSKSDAIYKLQNIIKKEEIELVVIGAPDSGVRSAILSVANKLEGVSVVTSDETLSSQNAKVKMIELGLGKKKRAIEDAYSAVEILQNYLESKDK